MNDPEHQMIVLTPRRRGRPRSAEPGSTVSAWIPTKYHDAIARIANERDISVSAVVARVLVTAIDKRTALEAPTVSVRAKKIT